MENENKNGSKTAGIKTEEHSNKTYVCPIMLTTTEYTGIRKMVEK